MRAATWALKALASRSTNGWSAALPRRARFSSIPKKPVCAPRNTSGFSELMQWSIEHGESESLQLVAEVTREAVDRLPAPVLHMIDGCEGRTVVGVILDQSLSESRRRFRQELDHKSA